MKGRVEQWYPIVGGVVFGLAYYYVLSARGPLPCSLKDLLAAVINVSAIAIGFLATAESVMLGLENKTVVARLKKINYFGFVVDYMRGALVLAFVLALVSAAGLLTDFVTPSPWHTKAFSAWLGLVAASLLAWIRIVSIFTRILRSDA